MSTPLWLFDERLPLFDRLVENIKTDVCVIGGGLGGLTTAYLLLKEGKKVCLIEDSLIGSGQSGRTMAQFSNCLDNRYFNIEKNHGPLGAYLAANSHTTALEFVENIIHSENIDCDFKKMDGYLFNPNEGQDKKLAREIQALHRSGLLRVSFISKTPLDSFDSGPCLHFPNQIQLHPIKYMKGLAQCILKYGGKIFNSSHAQEVKGGPTTLVKIKGGYNIQAKATVVATNAPINDLLALPIKQAAYRTYVLAFKIPPGSIRDGFYWDTEDPYHYMEVANDDTLLVGGEDHKTGQNNFPESSYRKIEEWTRQRFPFTQEIVAQWSGQIMKTLDGLAYLGRCPPIDGKNIYVITGDCGNGTTHCTIGALLISDLIMGRSNSWEALYNPSRINLKVTGAFVKENANMAVQFTHWMRGKNIDALEDLKREEGLVFKKGLERLAAYKDDMGRVEIMSAVCPHLGCIVAWNNAEKSWDCPCHGSRFDCHGKVIEGPAASDLKAIDINKNESQERMVPIGPGLVM